MLYTRGHGHVELLHLEHRLSLAECVGLARSANGD